MPGNTPWSDEEIRYLHTHKGDGIDAIARNLNRTQMAVKVRMSREGLLSNEYQLYLSCPCCGMTLHEHARNGPGKARVGPLGDWPLLQVRKPGEQASQVVTVRQALNGREHARQAEALLTQLVRMGKEAQRLLEE